MKVNLMPIKKGDTWTWTLKGWADKKKTEPVDMSVFEFTMRAVTPTGAVAFTLTDSDFLRVSDEERMVQLEKTFTATLAAGELYYQLDVTNQDDTSYEWFDGTIKVVA